MGKTFKVTIVALLAFGAGTCVSFFTLPLWVATLINVAKEGSRTDWLGFSGSIVGAAMTVGAAAAAWAAVQRQIAIQQNIAHSQAAIERFNIVQSQLAIIENEDRITRVISVRASWMPLIERTFLQGPELQEWQVSRAIGEVDSRLSDFADLEREFLVSGAQRWAFNGGPHRYSIFGAIGDAKIALYDARNALETAQIYRSNDAYRPEDIARCLAINFEGSCGPVEATCEQHRATLGDETVRLVTLLNALRKDAGL